MTKRLLAAALAPVLMMTTGCIAIDATETPALAAPTAPVGAINRIAIPGSDFPISSGVVIPPGAEIYYVSGIVPSIIDTEADPNSREAYGDTRQQTISVLSTMKQTMEAAGWSLGDIVMMRVYLVGDEATGGRLDFAGFMAGYSEFFATPEQPNKPARAVVQVAELIRPGWRVEIEAQAARVPTE